jgi:hypothetical protein
LLYLGRLNISHRSLKEIPEEVWRMYEVDPKSITVDFGGGTSDVWYEQIDLVRLVAADNVIEKIDKRISEFGALAFIDVSQIYRKSYYVKLFMTLIVYLAIFILASQ